MRRTFSYAAVTNDDHNAADGRFSTADSMDYAMHRLITITPEDLQQALLKGADLNDVAVRLRRRLKIPAASKTGGLPVLGQLQKHAPALHRLAEGWLRGESPETPNRTGKQQAFHLLPFCPQGDTRGYLRSIIKKLKPSVIALDATAFETTAALQYASSLYFSLGIAGHCMLNDHNGNPIAKIALRPDDFLPTVALHCYQHKIPLVPLGTPGHFVASEHQHTYSQMLSTLGREFTSQADPCRTPEALQKRAGDLMESLFASGPQLRMERENCITRSCALASRAYELLQAAASDKMLKGPILILHHIETSLDLPALITTFLQAPAALSELSCAPEPQPNGTLSRITPADAPAQDDPAAGAPLSRTAHTARPTILLERMAESIDPEEADRLIAAMAKTLRRHPRVGAIRACAPRWQHAKSRKRSLCCAAQSAVQPLPRLRPSRLRTEPALFRNRGPTGKKSLNLW